jgi:hypothetical protein
MRGMALVVVVEADNALRLQADGMAVVVAGAMLVHPCRRRATQMKVNTATSPSVACMTSPSHSLDVVRAGIKAVGEDRNEEGRDSLSGKMWE